MKVGWFVRGDIDGFFGLFVDNLLQLMLIAVLCGNVCGMPPELVYGRILPGAALSILFGNVFYAWQARKLAIRTGRTDVTALPYGINTVSLIAFVFLIIAPIYFETKDPNLAWQAGLFACLASALLECAGAFVGDWLRRHTPRAALLSSLAGIAITFISMGFVFQIFAMPAIAIVPALLVIFVYGGQIKLPLGLPGGFIAVALGVAMGWILRWSGYPYFQPLQEPYQFAVHFPKTTFSDMIAFLTNGQGWKYFSVIFPMALFNVIGSLQNLESAEAAGDRYDTRSSLLVNGFGSIVAASLGNPFPTTIYIGHPGWKAMGARWGYSILNGAVITVLCLIGGVTLVLKSCADGSDDRYSALDRHHNHGPGVPGSAQKTQCGCGARTDAGARGVGAAAHRNDPAQGRLQPVRCGTEIWRRPLRLWHHLAEPGFHAHVHDSLSNDGVCG